jgi:hypothetical protein
VFKSFLSTARIGGLVIRKSNLLSGFWGAVKCPYNAHIFKNISAGLSWSTAIFYVPYATTNCLVNAL